MYLIKKNFKPYLNKFVTEFIDDSLVYSRDEVNHADHLHIVLQTLTENKLLSSLNMNSG